MRALHPHILRCVGLTGLWLTVSLGLAGLLGCASTAERPLSLGEAAARDAARPILEFDPDANWSESYNRLVGLGQDSVTYLAGRAEMRRRVAPDDLQAMATLTLLRMLIDAPDAPRLSVRCYETTFDLMHLDLKVRGRSIGVPVLHADGAPGRWHDLYPGEFDDATAAEIDVEADRQLMTEWLRDNLSRAIQTGSARRLKPRIDALWPVLSRRFADIWTFEGGRGRFLACSHEVEALAALPQAGARFVHACSLSALGGSAALDDAPPGQTLHPAPLAASLLQVETEDYNLVRAACIWLGQSGEAGALDGLIQRVTSPSEIVSHNAKFALRYSRDPRIRQLMQRYKNVGEEEPVVEPDVKPRLRT